MKYALKKVTVTALVAVATVLGAHAQTTAFTYQGKLSSGTNAANGIYDLRFALFDALSAGSQVGSLLTNSAAAVSNGLFTVTLDFGANFPGANRWLELGVRTNGAGAFTTLTPRQKITSAPYAVTASNLTGTLPAGQLSGTLASGQLSGTYSSAVTFNGVGNSFVGAFTGNGANVSNLNAATLASGTVVDARLAANVARTNQVWLLGGNSGTTAGTQFLGTTDNQPLEFRVNKTRALRLEWTGGTPNVIGGYSDNFVQPGIVGAFIGGGGAPDFSNRVTATYGAVAGGLGNAVLAGDSFIGAGAGNTISGGADRSVLGGGSDNSIGADNSVIAGGKQNHSASSTTAIGGGYDNNIANSSQSGTIAGGDLNDIGAISFWSAIGGGYDNNIAANAPYATIPGGRENAATNYAFAAGRRAKADHTGAFVWADSTDADFASSGNNQFLIRAAGGVAIGLTSPAAQLHVSSSNSLTLQLNQENVTDHARVRLSVGNDASKAWDIGGRSNRFSIFNPQFGDMLLLDSNGLSVPGSIGSQGAAALDFKVNNVRGLRLEANASSAPNVIGGAAINSVATNISGAVIGGGSANTNRGDWSVIGGGYDNNIVGSLDSATIAGGYFNTIQSDAYRSTIGGGFGNNIAANAVYATIPGGRENVAASYAFAAGRRAKANHTGVFVWADSTDADFASTGDNQFLIRAAGGVGIGLTNPAAQLHVSSSNSLTLQLNQENPGDYSRVRMTVGNGGPYWDVASKSNRFVIYSSQFGGDMLQLDSNGLAVPGGFGSVGNAALDFKVNNVRGLRLEANASSAANVIGGAAINSVGTNISGAVIGGGSANTNRGNWSVIAAGTNNTITSGSQNAVIAGGDSNDIGAGAGWSAIGGGSDNNIATAASTSTIAGGGANNIGLASNQSTIGGGYGNNIESFSENSTIAGGQVNDIGTNSGSSIIGGGYDNNIAASSPVATIAGGEFNDIGSSSGSSIIGGGYDNNIAASSPVATIAGGEFNDIGSNSGLSTIGGGYDNDIGTNSGSSTIGGGSNNKIAGNSGSATVAGGSANDIGANSGSSAIGGGYNNNVSSNSAAAAIAGGELNDIGANSGWSAIGGGYDNNIAANAPYATIPGGRENAATSYAFAAGRRAKANHTGAFVWADSTDADFASTGNNQFLIRAAGGVGIGVTKPAARLHVHGDYNNTGAGGFLLDATDDGNPERYALRINPFAVDGSAVGYQFQTKSVSGGINVPLTFNHAGQVGIGNTAPGNLLVVGTGGAYCNGTTWVNGSDRNAKKDFSPVSPQEVLAKISALPITEWQYKADADGIKHVGPMAQDFHAAFSLNGADDTHIATVDEAGVALAAIQGLNEKVESGKRKAETRIQKLEAENAELRQSLEELKQVVGKLSHHQN